MAKSKNTNLEKGVYYRGPGQYQVKVRRLGPDGTPIKMPSKTFETADAANAYRNAIVGRLATDDFTDKSHLRKMTLKGLLQRYLDKVTPTKKGADAEKYVIQMWMRQPWAEWPLASVELAHIVAWRDRRNDEGAAPSTINNALNLLSAVYKKALEWEEYKGVVNPVIGVARIRGRKAREAYLEPEQEAALLAACRKGPPYLIWCTLLAVTTAMRAGEIRSLRWEHVYPEEGYLHVVNPKNNEERDVPLPLPEAIAVVESMLTLPRRIDGYVLGHPKKKAVDGGLTKDMLTHAFADAVAAAAKDLKAQAEAETDAKRKRKLEKLAEALAELTFHDLRHIATTRLAPLHRDALDLSKTTGHKTISQLARYYNEKTLDRVKRLRQNARELAEREARIAIEEVLAVASAPVAVPAGGQVIPLTPRRSRSV